jgi:hypothetical protein
MCASGSEGTSALRAAWPEDRDLSICPEEVWTRRGDGNLPHDRFSEHPLDAIKLLDALIGRAWGLENGLSHKSEFDRSDFDNLASLFDPEIVVAALTKTFGFLVANATFDECWKLKGDQQTACRFVALFNKVRAERTENKSASPETDEPTDSSTNASPKTPE